MYSERWADYHEENWECADGRSTPGPALHGVTPALLCHESPLSWQTMQIQPKSYHAYVALESFFLWLYQYAELLSFRGLCCSDNMIFIYRMKSGERSHSIVILLGFMYFLCAVSETAKTLALECGWCVSIGHSTLEITQTFLINATMHFQDKPACNSLCSIAEKQRAWNL